MRYIVDRIEEEFVVCENEDTGEMENIDVFLLPDGVEEGDILIFDEDLEIFYIDSDEKKLRKARIENRMEDIWEEEDLIEKEDSEE